MRISLASDSGHCVRSGHLEDFYTGCSFERVSHCYAPCWIQLSESDVRSQVRSCEHATSVLSHSRYYSHLIPKAIREKFSGGYRRSAHRCIEEDQALEIMDITRISGIQTSPSTRHLGVRAVDTRRRQS